MTKWRVSWRPTETRRRLLSLGIWIRKSRAFFDPREGAAAKLGIPRSTPDLKLNNWGQSSLGSGLDATGHPVSGLPEFWHFLRWPVHGGMTMVKLRINGKP